MTKAGKEIRRVHVTKGWQLMTQGLTGIVAQEKDKWGHGAIERRAGHERYREFQPIQKARSAM